ncbi:hypothetical protein HDV00_004052 [Rhizophlyctis rosea]|nr:hypothetical protein HDV00_004052 [Rhizophlyctis rosea]
MTGLQSPFRKVFNTSGDRPYRPNVQFNVNNKPHRVEQPPESLNEHKSKSSQKLPTSSFAKQVEGSIVMVLLNLEWVEVIVGRVLNPEAIKCEAAAGTNTTKARDTAFDGVHQNGVMSRPAAAEGAQLEASGNQHKANGHQRQASGSRHRVTGAQNKIPIYPSVYAKLDWGNHDTPQDWDRWGKQTKPEPKKSPQKEPQTPTRSAWTDALPYPPPNDNDGPELLVHVKPSRIRKAMKQEQRVISGLPDVKKMASPAPNRSPYSTTGAGVGDTPDEENIWIFDPDDPIGSTKPNHLRPDVRSFDDIWREPKRPVYEAGVVDWLFEFSERAVPVIGGVYESGGVEWERGRGRVKGYECQGGNEDVHYGVGCFCRGGEEYEYKGDVQEDGVDEGWKGKEDDGVGVGGAKTTWNEDVDMNLDIAQPTSSHAPTPPPQPPLTPPVANPHPPHHPPLIKDLATFPDTPETLSNDPSSLSLPFKKGDTPRFVNVGVDEGEFPVVEDVTPKQALTTSQKTGQNKPAWEWPRRGGVEVKGVGMGDGTTGVSVASVKGVSAMKVPSIVTADNHNNNLPLVTTSAVASTNEKHIRKASYLEDLIDLSVERGGEVGNRAATRDEELLEADEDANSDSLDERTKALIPATASKFQLIAASALSKTRKKSGEKKPPITPQPPKRHTNPCDTLWIGQLPHDASSTDLEALFSKYDGYKAAHPRGGVCFVQMGGGVVSRAQEANADADEMPRAESGERHSVSTPAKEPVMNVTPTAPAAEINQYPPCDTLWIGRLPPDASSTELEARFSKCFGRKGVRLSFGLKGLVGHVQFQDVASATRCIGEMSGLRMRGGEGGGIVLEYSKRGVWRGRDEVVQPVDDGRGGDVGGVVTVGEDGGAGRGERNVASRRVDAESETVASESAPGLETNSNKQPRTPSPTSLAASKFQNLPKNALQKTAKSKPPPLITTSLPPTKSTNSPSSPPRRHPTHPPCNTLYVAHLPLYATQEVLEGVFKVCDGYQQIRFKPFATGSCFVEFDTTANATKALKELDGCYLREGDGRSWVRLDYSMFSVGRGGPAGAGLAAEDGRVRRAGREGGKGWEWPRRPGDVVRGFGSEVGSGWGVGGSGSGVVSEVQPEVGGEKACAGGSVGDRSEREGSGGVRGGERGVNDGGRGGVEREDNSGVVDAVMNDTNANGEVERDGRNAKGLRNPIANVSEADGAEDTPKTAKNDSTAPVDAALSPRDKEEPPTKTSTVQIPIDTLPQPISLPFPPSSAPEAPLTAPPQQTKHPKWIWPRKPGTEVKTVSSASGNVGNAAPIAEGACVDVRKEGPVEKEVGGVESGRGRGVEVEVEVGETNGGVEGGEDDVGKSGDLDGVCRDESSETERMEKEEMEKEAVETERMAEQRMETDQTSKPLPSPVQNPIQHPHITPSLAHGLTAPAAEAGTGGVSLSLDAESGTTVDGRENVVVGEGLGDGVCGTAEGEEAGAKLKVTFADDVMQVYDGFVGLMCGGSRVAGVEESSFSEIHAPSELSHTKTEGASAPSSHPSHAKIESETAIPGFWIFPAARKRKYLTGVGVPGGGGGELEAVRGGKGDDGFRVSGVESTERRMSTRGVKDIGNCMAIRLYRKLTVGDVMRVQGVAGRRVSQCNDDAGGLIGEMRGGERDLEDSAWGLGRKLTVGELMRVRGGRRRVMKIGGEGDVMRRLRGLQAC